MRTVIALSCFAVVCAAACTPPSAAIHQAGRNRNTALLQEKLSSEKPWLVEDAAYHLGRLRVKSAKTKLIEVLGKKAVGPYARIQAAVALSRIGATDAVNAMSGALERADNPEERYYLTMAIGSFCTIEAKAAVNQAAEDSNVMVARGARKALQDCAKKGGGK